MVDPACELRIPVGNPGASNASLRPSIIPLFLPFAGCPHRCLFCAQDKQTGQHSEGSRSSLIKLQNLLDALPGNGRPRELAFYGGTFTALPFEFQEACLRLALHAKKEGRICRIRCSTRPDALTPCHLDRLRDLGMDLIELGIQSFNTPALIAAERGYDSETAHAGCSTVKEHGFELGIQLLPGMPGVTPAVFLQDAAEALHFKPDCLRFYPCLVVDGTPLAEHWKAETYAPWTLDATLATLGSALADAWKNRTPVIRLSLAPEESLDKNVLAGPRHPALGNRIQAEALFLSLSGHLASHAFPPDELQLPRFCQGFFRGYQNDLIPRWNALGVSEKNVSWTDGEQALLRWAHL